MRAFDPGLATACHDARPARGGAPGWASRPVLCTSHPDRRPHRARLGRGARAHVSVRYAHRDPAARRAQAARAQPAAVRALFAADPLAARIPVLLVHGLVDNRSVFSVMSRNLRRRGFTHICTWNYSPLLTDMAARRRRPRRAHRAHLRADRPRPGARRRPQPRRPDRALLRPAAGRRPPGGTRWSPWARRTQGSVWAHVVPTPLIRQLRPGSPVIRELARAGARAAARRITAVYSDLDQMVLPTSSGRCDHPTSARATCWSAGRAT